MELKLSENQRNPSIPAAQRDAFAKSLIPTNTLPNGQGSRAKPLHNGPLGGYGGSYTAEEIRVHEQSGNEANSRGMNYVWPRPENDPARTNDPQLGGRRYYAAGQRWDEALFGFRLPF